MEMSSFLFAQNSFNISESKHFVQKKIIILMRGVQSETIFKTRNKSSVFKKILFTETGETNIRNQTTKTAQYRAG